MFSHEQPMVMPHSGSLKRLHEDDPAEFANSATMGFNEHRNKRFHALPLRTSPTTRRLTPAMNFSSPITVPSPAAFQRHDMTPSDSGSGSDELALRNQHQQWQAAGTGSAQQQIPQLSESLDTDMDMEVDNAGTDAAQGTGGDGAHLQPGAFQPDQIGTNIMGRIPTPIQPSFAAQVRGNSWNGSTSNPLQAGPSPLRYDNEGRHSQFGLDSIVESSANPLMQALSIDRTVPRTVDHPSLADFSMVQNRSLPSPISESGGEELGSPTMIWDSCQVRSQSVDNLATPKRPESAMSLPPMHHNHAHGGMDPNEVDIQSSPFCSSQAADSCVDEQAMQTDQPATPSPRKGHTRSRHTLNSWTQQPGMKKSFSIGYRADCEKCRNKVPGHFNHIIVS